MVGIGGPQPDAGPVIQPQPTPFGLFGRHLQAFLPPDPFYTFVVHMPAFFPQQRGDAPIAVAAVGTGQVHNPRRELHFLRATLADVALRRSWLFQHPAGTPFRHA